MVEEQRRRLEFELTKLVDDLDKSYLRNMQREMHQCAVKCCDDPTLSMQGVQNCVENCSNKLTKANNYVQQELNHFQTRVQRCVMDCNDEVRDKISASQNEQEVDRYSKMFETCAIKCVDKHIGLLPNMLKSMKIVLRKATTLQQNEELLQ